MKPFYEQKFLPEIEPSWKGAGGEAWEFPASCIDPKRAGVGVWFLHYPVGNPLWYAYAITLVHLRHCEGLAPPRIFLQDATHEFMVHAMNPEWKPAFDPRELFKHCLLPVNYATQFLASSDEDAKRYVRRAVVACVNGELNPDTDAVMEWARRYGDCMIKK